MTTSSTLAISCKRAKPKCCARQTLDGNRSTRSRKSSRRWVCISAWKCRVGRRRISKNSQSASRIITKPHRGLKTERREVRDASRQGSPQAQQEACASPGYVCQHGCGPDQARADRYHAAQGERAAPGGGKTCDAREERPSACTPSGNRRAPRRRHGQETF